MLTNKETLEYERMRLEKVVNEIKLQLDIGSDAVRNYKREAIDLQKKMWEDVRCAPTDLSDLEAPAQIWQYQVEIANQARKYKFSSDKVGRLERMLQSPYFGRIDFIEDGEEKAEQIYIGICSLTTGKTREILVYDWRAPIAGMFYDFEIGLAGYDCPGGSITGQMLLKRQYKIEYSDIIYMFDSSLSINDEMLREILGKSTDNRMKTIVTSIQREQNTVIRNSQDRILIVEGPAGSGKTSIALHRAAYLLYKFRDSIKSENILVFSPNHVFEDYISNVLPELGEENIQRSTFTSFFADMFDAKYRIESMNQQMEYILSVGANELRLRGIEFKSSQQFLEILRNYVKHLENAMSLHFKDIVYNNRLVVSAEDIYQLFRSDYNRFFYAKRLEKLRQRLFYLLEQCEEMRVQENQALTEEEKVLADMKSKQELGNLRNSITQMTFFDIYTLYKDLFENIGSFAKTADKQQLEELHDIGVFTICQLNRNTINYEDAAPIIFLKTALDTAGGTKSIKHAIIDEAQDYTVIHYEIFKKAFEHSNMTILGDENQSVNGYMNIGSFDNIPGIFDTKATKSIALSKSYRSSKEIADFCREVLLSSNHTDQLERHGNKPRIVKLEKRNLSKRLADDINNLKSKGNKLIAVICKTAGQCEILYKYLCKYMDISLVSNQNEVYNGGVVIIPSYLAKGLEFDAVLVNSVEADEYFRAEDRRLLYTVCTRALHELYLYYFDNVSGFIKNISDSLYTTEEDI